MRGGTTYPVRLQFAKAGKIRWISHRDTARAFIAALAMHRHPARETDPPAV